MSTPRRQTDRTFTPPETPFTVRDAPRTFDPFNTNRTPEMFENRWQVTEN
ncbi:MAG: hypothetical protein V5A25_10475 [Halovenus sp.]